MKRKPHSRRKLATTKSVLRLPDLEHAKAAVLNSLTSLDAKRGYRHVIDRPGNWPIPDYSRVLGSSDVTRLGTSCRPEPCPIFPITFLDSV
jgi:hypothetical protein